MFVQGANENFRSRILLTLSYCYFVDMERIFKKDLIRIYHQFPFPGIFAIWYMKMEVKFIWMALT